MFGPLFVAALAGQAMQDTPPAVPAPVAAPAPPADPLSPAMRAAQANRPLARTMSVFVAGPTPIIPPDAIAKGEHGKVVVKGILGVDGRFSEAYVAAGSRSPQLDALGLDVANASRFTPAKDAQGNPIAIIVTMPVEFSNAHSPGKGWGILRYRCDQFLRDRDW